MTSRNQQRDVSAPLLEQEDESAGHRQSPSSRQRRRLTHLAQSRQAELAATFGDSDDGLDAADGDDDDEEERDPYNGYARSQVAPQASGTVRQSRGNSRSSLSASPPGYSFSRPHAHQDPDVFFDAGDALPGGARGTQDRPSEDPLGANRINSQRETLHPSDAANRPQTGTQGTQSEQGRQSAVSNASATYDFENTSYFTPPRSNVRSSRANSLATTPDRSGQHHSVGNAGDDGALLEDSPGVSQTPLARARFALGRFGRLVGMRMPGATYSTLTNEDDTAADVTRRRVMGSGVNQDGVFANLNAKPERRRRRGNGSDDRGDDDDLADEVMPPSYEVAAADAAPPYWETTIIGGPGGMHPLAAGGLGWTPGGAHVGALEDLIIDGLPLGNFFGFAWNLLVSMSFQFVGFLLTYLLHTTHAARCGSRAGLGITLVQYGFYLRTRAQQIAEGKPLDDGLVPLPPSPEPTGSSDAANSNLWWGEVIHPHVSQAASNTARSLASRGLHFVLRNDVPSSTTGPSANTTLADALAADNGLMGGAANESMTASTEWLAYILMGLGWFILLTSILSYWRVHRWGTQLVEAARRDAESAEGDEAAAAGTDGQAPRDPTAPVGFLVSLREALRNGRQGGAGRGNRQNRPTNTGEDWIIYPGRPRRDSLSDLASSGLPLPVTDPRQHRQGTRDSPLSTYDGRRLLDDLDG